MTRIKLELIPKGALQEVAETSLRIPENEFDAFYDVVMTYLKTQGSVSEGGLENADFSSSRWVDPISTLTVVSNIPVTQPIAEGLVLELAKLKKAYIVVFDGGIETCCVTSGGRFLKAQH